MRVIDPIEITEDMLLSSNVSEDDYAEWDAGTTYGLGDTVIVIDTYHKVYESLQAGNLNKFPPDYLTGTPYWLEVSATNRWKMFDSVAQTQTINTGSIEVEIAASNINSVFVLNSDAVFILINLTDSNGTLVYADTVRLVGEESVAWGDGVVWEGGTGWQGGGFSDLIELVIIRSDLPVLPNCTLKLTIAGTEATAKCGKVIIGTHRTLGTTKYSPSIGIKDYSIKKRDDFGNYYVEERAFTKTLSCTFMIETAIHKEILRVLSNCRSSSLLWIVSTSFNTTMIYGFYKDFSMRVTTHLTECDISIEGLV
jgi:hypothetical protein